MVSHEDIDFSLPGEKEFQEGMLIVFRKALASRGFDEAAQKVTYSDLVCVVTYEYLEGSNEWLDAWGDQVSGNPFLRNVADLLVQATLPEDIGCSLQETVAGLRPHMQELREQFPQWMPGPSELGNNPFAKRLLGAFKRSR